MIREPGERKCHCHPDSLEKAAWSLAYCGHERAAGVTVLGFALALIVVLGASRSVLLSRSVSFVVPPSNIAIDRSSY